MPVDWKRYPDNWDEIVERIRLRSGEKCEWCGVPNHVMISRDPDDGKKFRILEGMALEAATVDGDKVTYIVLTTAHLGTPHPDGRPGDKHDKHDNRDENLAHLCQRCHLLYDLDDHVRNAAVTRRRKKKEMGFLELDLEPKTEEIMKEHFVKCWPEFFTRAWDGEKPFEIRKNDRDYAPKDRITMQEWDPTTSEYSGRSLTGTIMFMVDGVSMWGLRDGFCAFSWKEEARTGRKEAPLEDGPG